MGRFGPAAGLMASRPGEPVLGQLPGPGRLIRLLLPLCEAERPRRWLRGWLEDGWRGEAHLRLVPRALAPLPLGVASRAARPAGEPGVPCPCAQVDSALGRLTPWPPSPCMLVRVTRLGAPRVGPAPGHAIVRRLWPPRARSGTGPAAAAVAPLGPRQATPSLTPVAVSSWASSGQWLLPRVVRRRPPLARRLALARAHHGCSRQVFRLPAAHQFPVLALPQWRHPCPGPAPDLTAPSPSAASARAHHGEPPG